MRFENAKLVEITTNERTLIRNMIFDSNSHADAQHRITRYLVDIGYSVLFSRSASFHVMMVVLCNYPYLKEVSENVENTV